MPRNLHKASVVIEIQKKYGRDLFFTFPLKNTKAIEQKKIKHNNNKKLLENRIFSLKKGRFTIVC